MKYTRAPSVKRGPDLGNLSWVSCEAALTRSSWGNKRKKKAVNARIKNRPAALRLNFITLVRGLRREWCRDEENIATAGALLPGVVPTTKPDGSGRGPQPKRGLSNVSKRNHCV